jgi:predicted alpha/beta hydrolase
MAAAAPEELVVRARDGYALAATHYRAHSRVAADAVVIVNGAMGVERDFYAPFAAFLAGRGYDVLCYDYRGVGGSRLAPASAERLHMADWGRQDFAGMIEHARGPLGARNIAVVGHSAGGQILGLADNNSHIAAALLVAAQGGYWKLWTGLWRVRMVLYMYLLLPALARGLGYVPRAVFGAEVPGSIVDEWARWCRTEDYLLGGDGDARRPGYARVRAPMLALSFSDDHYAPPAAVEWLLQQYCAATVTRRHITPDDVGVARIDHFGFFLPTAEPTLWHYAATWLASQLL